MPSFNTCGDNTTHVTTAERERVQPANSAVPPTKCVSVARAPCTVATCRAESPARNGAFPCMPVTAPLPAPPVTSSTLPLAAASPHAAHTCTAAVVEAVGEAPPREPSPAPLPTTAWTSAPWATRVRTRSGCACRAARCTGFMPSSASVSTRLPSPQPPPCPPADLESAPAAGASRYSSSGCRACRPMHTAWSNV